MPKFFHKSLARLFFWGLKQSKPPFGIRLIANCKGILENKPANIRVSVDHVDGYVLTAIPVVACLKQYVENNQRKPGLHFQANFVEPTQFVEDLEKMGLTVTQFLESPLKPKASVSLTS